jgi:hypothetical protein
MLRFRFSFSSVLLLLTGAAWLVGCGSTTPAREAGDRESAAAAALVTCTDEGATILTPRVRAYEDGIHITAKNVSGRTMVLNYEVDGGDAGGGDFDVPLEGWTEVIPLTGESLGVNCIDKATDDRTLDFALDYETIDVEQDPRLARSTELACSDPTDEDIQTSVVGPDPLELSRRYLRSRKMLRSGDRLEQVATTPVFPVVLLVRSGTPIASLWYEKGPEDADAELHAVQLCPS